MKNGFHLSDRKTGKSLDSPQNTRNLIIGLVYPETMSLRQISDAILRFSNSFLRHIRKNQGFQARSE
jgi:hypothetical protein